MDPGGARTRNPVRVAEQPIRATRLPDGTAYLVDPEVTPAQFEASLRQIPLGLPQAVAPGRRAKLFEADVAALIALEPRELRGRIKRRLATEMGVSEERVNQCLRPDDAAQFYANDVPKILRAVGSTVPGSRLVSSEVIGGARYQLAPMPRLRAVGDLAAEALEASGSWGAFAAELAQALVTGVDGSRDLLLRRLRAHIVSVLSIQAALEAGR